MLFSTAGAVIKDDSFTGIQVSSGRSAVAAITLSLMVRSQVSVSWHTMAVAIPYAVALTLFVTATKLTTAANAIFLQSTAPIFLVFIGRTLLQEKVVRRDVGYLALMAVGLTICLAGEARVGARSPNPPLGNILAVLAAIAYAGTLAGLRWAAVRRPRENPLSPVIVGNVLACVGLLPWALPFPSVDAFAWGNLVYLGTVQISLAYICLTAALRHLPAFEVSLLLLIEPVLNPVWTWFVRDERPSMLALVGGACILAACAQRALDTRRSGPPASH